jgi:hypothetical protein
MLYPAWKDNQRIEMDNLGPGPVVKHGDQRHHCAVHMEETDAYLVIGKLDRGTISGHFDYRCYHCYLV